MSDLIIYEHPLNERIRTLLRLEHLFQQNAFHLSRPEAWSSRATINSLLDITNILARADIKSEIIKELERHAATLGKIRSAPGVNTQRLDTILEELGINIDRLYQINSQIGRRLRENDFLNSIAQRNSIPGGSCAFDLPQYHHWLQRPHAERQDDLQRWAQEFSPLESASSLLLSLIRSSTDASWESAEGGFFQRSLGAQTPVQLVRVGLAIDSTVYPEISGSKHRFTIRFLEPSEQDRPAQTQADLKFQLTCCLL
ncbi:cell division protein ZapD [Pseudomonadota bacterium]